jgi:hypothetical protein
VRRIAGGAAEPSARIASARRARPPVRSPKRTPKVRGVPRLSLSSRQRMPTGCSRAAGRVRTVRLSGDFAQAWRNQPARSVLSGIISSAASA